MPSFRRAAVTGIGVVCPLGLDGPSFAQALREGRSGQTDEEGEQGLHTGRMSPAGDSFQRAASTSMLAWEKTLDADPPFAGSR